MCGICGIIREVGNFVDETELIRMRDRMLHRGPEAGGLLVDGNIGLGHRRLKIIDLSESANQPMYNEDRSLAVVFNGEIYNFKDVGRRLAARNHQFRTQCDTEVILHGYEEWGERCVDEFNGMFAFAVFDRKRRELFIARDRLGIKPLYYYSTPRLFLFASEIKAFLGCTDFRAEPNMAALTEHFVCRSCVDPVTMFRGVQSLPPGCWLRVGADLQPQTRQYWTINFDAPAWTGSAAAAESEVHNLLQESVVLQEMSDVPIGTQLSGGTDSSLVSALMAGHRSQPIQTFSVGFDEEGFNELVHARIVADQLKSQHHEIILTNRDFVASLEKLIWHRDEPLVHANSAGVYAICRDAKPSATVLLTGEGADETFAGYYRYEWLRKCFLAKNIVPHFLGRIATRSRSAHLSSLAKAFSEPRFRLIAMSTASGSEPLREFLDPVGVEHVIEQRAALFKPAAKADWLTQALYYDLVTYLPPVLIRQDKMSMACAVETRVPFLDHRLVELAFRLPSHLKLNHGEGKCVVKRVASRYLPREIIYRPKVGFSFPLEPWMRSKGGLGDMLSVLVGESSFISQIFPRSAIARMIDTHRRGTENHSDVLWTLLGVEVWHRRFFGAQPSVAQQRLVSLQVSTAAQKTNVAQVVLSLKVGGLERVVVNLLKGMRDSRYRNIVFCLDEPGEFAAELEELGIPLYALHKKPGIDRHTIQELARLFRLHKIKIVHTHNPAPHLHGLSAAGLARTPVCIHTRHGRNFPDDKRVVWLNRMLSWRTDAIVPVSKDAGDVARNVERIHSRRLRQIWNGVDTDEFRILTPPESRGPIIGTVARLSPEKDYLTMLAAFRLVANQMPEARLVFVGDGPCDAELRAKTGELGLQDRVKFLGMRSDICKLLNTFSLFSLSSTTEGLSMTVLEAMACGTPVVATDVGGNREMVHPPECGLLVPAQNPAALAEAYLRLLRNPHERLPMAVSSRQRIVQDFSVHSMLRQYLALYDELLATKHR